MTYPGTNVKIYLQGNRRHANIANNLAAAPRDHSQNSTVFFVVVVFKTNTANS